MHRLAAFAGRFVGAVGRSLPGVLGPLLVIGGVALLSIPAALILAGLILWALDRRIP